jgi:hypothetical protein
MRWKVIDQKAQTAGYLGGGDRVKVVEDQDERGRKLG